MKWIIKPILPIGFLSYSLFSCHGDDCPKLTDGCGDMNCQRSYTCDCGDKNFICREVLSRDIDPLCPNFTCP